MTIKISKMNKKKDKEIFNTLIYASESQPLGTTHGRKKIDKEIKNLFPNNIFYFLQGFRLLGFFLISIVVNFYVSVVLLHSLSKINK